MDKLSVEKLKQYKYFANLSDGALQAIVEKAIPIDVTEGTQIIKEGSSGDFFYFVSSGEVEVVKDTKWGQSAKIANLRSGEGFGDLAILSFSPRMTSVIAKTRAKLYKLSRRDFEGIILLDNAFRDVLFQKVSDLSQFKQLKTLQPFAQLEPKKMVVLIDKLKHNQYKAGENIFSQGEPGDLYYIIRSGHVAVIRQEGDKKPEQVAVLIDGEGFGEEALMTNKSRNATVTALDNVHVLALEKADFDDTIKKSYIEWASPENVLKDKSGDSILIDVRTLPEYEEEHIEGAINIPIAELRNRYEELDPAQHYYTYCSSSSRGETAAFLLGSMGLKVRVIKGGLRAWEGPVE